MTDNINRMDITEFREAGYLQEVNRCFLHTAGLALEVDTGFKDTDELRDWFVKRGVQFGQDALDCVWTFIKLAGLDKEHLSGVWDYRADPEGMIFGGDLLDRQKAVRVRGEIESHVPAREKLFGSVIQPVPPG